VHYVYILQSLDHGDRHYVGVTGDLRARVAKHNAGDVSHTAKFRPWQLSTYVAFSDDAKAFAFEKYLKSGSGRAFAKRHL
jgi:putative endonuclease